MLRAGVGGVMAVGKQASLIYHQSSCYASLCIGVALCVPALLIYVRQEGRYGLVYVVAAAERAHDTLLLCRVSLLLGGGVYAGGYAAAVRPLAHISPVMVGGKHLVRIQGFTLCMLEVILYITWAARPVHQPLGLVGGIVEEVYAYPCGQRSAYGLVLLACHAATQQYHKPHAGCFGCVGVRSIHKRLIAVQQTVLLPGIGLRVVYVKR